METTDLTTLRYILVALAAAATLFWTGCGGGSNQCLPGEEGCEDDEECSPACATGQRCAGGQCVVDAAQCSSVGESCAPGYETRTGFLCVDWDGAGSGQGVCSTVCAADGSCPDGSQCFVLQSSRDTACQSDAQCRQDMMCVQGMCRYTACQPSECSGRLSGQQTCADKYTDDPRFADGARCVGVDSGSNYCMPAGPKQREEACISAVQAAQQQVFSQTCAVGLGCVGQVCRTLCEADEDCGGDDSCVVGGGEFGEGVGFCAQTCVPFTSGECGQDQTCRPIDAQSGHCVAAGSTAAFASCEPGANECEPGTLCIEYPSAVDPPVGRCHPICDVSAGPAAEDGRISEGAQEARDQTCPQPPPASAGLRLIHAAPALGPVDAYARDRQEPLATGLGFEQALPAVADGAWIEIDGGRYEVAILPAGAPRTDRPVAQLTVDVAAGSGAVVALGPPEPSSSEQADATAIEVSDATTLPAEPRVRLVHLVSDADPLDVVAVPAGAARFATGNQTELAADLGFGRAAALVAAPAQQIDVVVFEAGADRSQAANAVLEFGDVSLSAASNIILRGTLDVDDQYDAEKLSVLALADAPSSRPQGPVYSCTARDGDTFGYCQQVCSGGVDDFGQQVCQGEAMGCRPTEFAARSEWLTLCAPLGDLGAGEACEPAQPYNQCGEGFYCLEYGAGAATLGQPPGECTPLCSVDAQSDALGCHGDQSCQPVVYDGSSQVGRCGYKCEPGDDYADASCPERLRSCTPVASLQQDTAGQTPPMVEHHQPYCTASGTVGAGQPCRGGDCSAGSECLFPRSQQTDLVATLLSPYFGASGLQPSCTLQCDPFDGDSSAVQCDQGQTCLFNYPWNAEVGHCAPIAEQRRPGEACQMPGLACGIDSVCVMDGGQASCFRFCDYLGADAQRTRRRDG